MKIKKIAYILCGLLLVSCNDSFLERYPDTDLSDKTYFTSEKDLELYTNTFYNELIYYYHDYATDNASIVSIRPRACFFPLFSFLPLWLHYNLNPLCVQY